MATYTNSPLVGYTRLVSKHSGRRTHAIDRITPHCVVGQVTAARLGDIFSGTRDVSSNYGIAQTARGVPPATPTTNGQSPSNARPTRSRPTRSRRWFTIPS